MAIKVGSTELSGLSERERFVLDTIDRLGLFGGKVSGALEVEEARTAQKLSGVFSDPRDRAIAESLLSRYFPDSARPTHTQLGGAAKIHGPGLVQAPDRSKLSRLFAPRSVAVIGATGDSNRVADTVLKSLEGFAGKVHVVSAKGLVDRPTVDSASKLPKVDLAILAIPAAQIPEALQALGEKGTKNAIVISGGFKELGAEGRALEDRLVAIAKKYELNVVGPNSVGVITPQINASYSAGAARSGGVGLLSQSGAIVTASLSDLQATGFSALVSMGNQSVLELSDYLEELGRNSQTKVIATYVEQIKDGPRFLEVAARVGRDKPIVMLRGGKSATGERASASHTGALAGSGAAYSAAFRKAGVIEVENQEELLDLARTFGSSQPLPKGRNFAVLTNAGGLAILTADAADPLKLEFAKLSEGTLAKLRAILPPEVSAKNPVDLFGDARSDRYQKALEIVMADSAVDGVICLASPQGMTDAPEIARVIANVARSGGKPVLASLQGEAEMADAHRLLEHAGVPSFPTAERAARALARMADYGELRARKLESTTAVSVDVSLVEQALEKLPRGPEGRVGAETLEALRATGLKVVSQRMVSDSTEALAAADALGYPVALKIRSPDVVHKSDSGGVALGISSPKELEKACADMLERVKSKVPGATIDGFEVQNMAPKGHELIVGVVRDPTFGPMVMLGSGGIYVEVLKDFTFELAPLSEAGIDRLIAGLKAKPLLEGARGQPRIDFEALRDLLRKVSALASNHPELLELDLNPVRVSPEGAIALDARARLS
ncbi:MAG: acetate--CoA ligase family protein [Deltaproteobacteria bacterium]|nr:acetate--CoA ligase family protein [Deltaproteobacteria bacterium]